MVRLIRIRSPKYAKMRGDVLRKKCRKGDKKACNELYWRRTYPEFAFPARSPMREMVRGPGPVTGYGPYGGKRRKVRRR